MNNLELLRREMRNRSIDAVIVPSGDTHFGEYVPPHFKCREWLTGFSGSAGTAVATLTEAAVFTDPRYFLQAESQLGTDFTLQKMDMPDSISVADYIKQRVASGKVGVDTAIYSAAEYKKLEADLHPLALVDIGGVFDKIWTDRPKLPANPAFLLDIKFAGTTAADKLAAAKQALQPPPNSIYIVSALDQTAWLLNLRGGDLRYTPVALAYSIIDWAADSVILFIDKSKLSAQAVSQLAGERVRVEDYAVFTEKLPSLVKGKTAVYHPDFTSRLVERIIAANAERACPESRSVPCINDLKSQKNAAETEGFRSAMLYDVAAWVKFWHWLEQNVDGGQITEMSAAQKLRSFRAESDVFVEESFAPIVAFGAHGAIVHYSAAPETNSPISRRSFVLIDTGAQYYCGTTDITRTLHLGSPDPQQKRDYTLTLKGHIALSRAIFPEGVRGAQIDALARQYLWQHHLHYLHGTGHGVGHFLGVHEGPQSIRLNENPAPLRRGMVLSCEPGLYRAGEYGIRIENLVLVADSGGSEFGSFYRFETLTLCPYDLNCIDILLLADEDIAFINAYHALVYERLAPLLNQAHREFLKGKCGKIQ